jgi:hypothetical protein
VPALVLDRDGATSVELNQVDAGGNADPLGGELERPDGAWSIGVAR